MENRRTIFPGTASEPTWLLNKDSPSQKRPAESPPVSPGEVPKLLKRSPASLLPQQRELVENAIGSKRLFSTPTHGKLAALLPVQTKSPWSCYRRILVEDQGGKASLCHSLETTSELVVVRTTKSDASSLGGSLRKCSHVNIVPLHRAFKFEGQIHFIYSTMSVPLTAIECVAQSRFELFEIAAICKEVLQGILYIHTHLQTGYGQLNSDNILFDSRASIKLANIGESMIVPRIAKQQDVIGLGALALKLLEIVPSGAATDQEDRGGDIVQFAESSRTAAASDLEGLPFLKLSAGSACLIPRVAIAERAWFRSWELCEPTNASPS